MKPDLFEQVRCNLCGADSPIIIYPSSRGASESIDPSEFRSSGDELLKDPLVKCSVCGLQYVTPRVNAELALQGYANTADETFASQAEARERTFRRCLRAVERAWKKPPGRVLDVGTANGSFLKVAKEAGWNVSGCEPNRWLANWCEEHYGIRVTTGTILDGDYPDSSFDVVTLWDVLEHTPDPMATLRQCGRILRPGGLLVVNYPDIGSSIARLMGRKWVFLVTVHYYYFTRQTIAQALEKNGLKVLSIRPHIQSLELEYILRRSIPFVGVLAKALHGAANALRIGNVQVAYWIGQTLVIAAKDQQR